MVDLFGASAEASDYLVKTEHVLGRVMYQGEDSSYQSLSHRSERVSEELLILGESAVYRWLRGLIIIKQRSKRQLHSEHSEGRTDHFENLSADNDERLSATVTVVHSSKVEAVGTEDGDSFVCALST
jgi:hypothetical protein